MSTCASAGTSSIPTKCIPFIRLLQLGLATHLLRPILPRHLVLYRRRLLGPVDLNNHSSVAIRTMRLNIRTCPCFVKEKSRHHIRHPQTLASMNHLCTVGQSFRMGEHSDLDHVHAHNLMTASGNSEDSAITPLRKTSTNSENDHVPELVTPGEHTETGAEPTSPRKRRYSENATHLIESRLATQPVHRRGCSVEQIRALDRTISDHAFDMT